MFCFQCQETINGKGCAAAAGACGKLSHTADIQDDVVLNLKRGALYAQALKDAGKEVSPDFGHFIAEALFTTITNANFDDSSLQKYIDQAAQFHKELKAQFGSELPQENAKSGVLATENEDIRSLREIITYGLKGAAAYMHHAANLGYESEELYNFYYKALAALLDDSLSQDELLSYVVNTGDAAVKAMALLDKANTSTYGNPEITSVNIGVGTNPGILVSGHDLKDLEDLLKQSEGSGVDIYTHSEMLPAHYYPQLKKYKHLVGNYGNAWWKQTEEFPKFNGPVLFTTNCLVPNALKGIADRVFTTNATGFPGCVHIEADSNGKKDFSAIINMAKTLPAPTQIESGSIVGGFAHAQVFALADKVVEAVKSGAIKKFVVMSGCDGRHPTRDYYTKFAKALPEDTVILTSGCAKYRYNKLGLKDIGGIPRVLDAGQCNDSYSWAVVAMKLKEIFQANDINDLPIVFNVAWYEQKAVAVLLALLSLGIKNIHIGPTLPAFVSPNVLDVLIKAFGLGGISTVDEDIARMIA
jgi:hydroxylamine reductase